MVPSLYADSMVWPKVVSLSGISSPSSIQLASPVSSAMGILRVPELVRMTVARPRKMLFSSSASTSFFSNSSGTVKPPSVSSPTDRALRTSP